MTIEEIQAELQEEIDLCNKYFIEEDMHKEHTEHERLALKIVTMCMQTLSSLKDGELEDYKHIKQWKSDVIDEFCKYDCNSVEEVRRNGYNKAIDDFVKSIVDRGLSANDDKYCITHYDNYLKVIKELAEQLKAGGENEQSI